ncbi:MAG: hypothetical protein RL693_1966 [Verrucomicrobiota bacterium]|jgi:hypothetical protein
MKFQLAVLAAVIFAGIAATAAIAELADVTPMKDNSAGMSHCDMGQMSHDQAGGMSCHSDGKAAAPAKGGCCK